MTSYIKPSNFKAGAKFGIYIYIGVTIASLCIAPFVFTFAPYLILPFALLVSKPIAWIALGAVFIVAVGLTFSATKPLFDMAKDSLHRRKMQEKGFVKLKTLDNDHPKVSPKSSCRSSNAPLDSPKSSHRGSNASLDSQSSSSNSPRVLPSSSCRSSETSRDSSDSHGNLLSKGIKMVSNLFSTPDDATHGQQNLVDQVKAGNNGYWLQQHDIAHIARAVYKYSENLENNIYFCIPGNVNSLNEGLKEYKNQVEQKKLQGIFTSVINLGNHWVTLVVSYNPSDKECRAYYCDSFGRGLQNANSALKNIQLANEITDTQIEPLTKEVRNLIVQSEENPGDAKIEEEKENTKEALRCVRGDKSKLVNKQIDVYYIVAVLQETLGISNARSSETKQQTDGYNCGIFALLNAKTITDMLIAGKSDDEISKALSEHKPSASELKKKRREFAEALMKDPAWQKSQKNVLSCEIESAHISQAREKKR